MKYTQIITGCALAVGLMTVASNQTQAASSGSSGKIVVDNALYSPINVKVTVKYVDGNKIKQASATSKDLLKDLGFNTQQVVLCLGEDGDVYVVNKKNGDVVDISASETNGMRVIINEQIYTEKYSGKDDSKYNYNSEGQIEVQFMGDSSQFDLTGVYSAKLDNNTNSNKGTQQVKTSAQAKNLSGMGSVIDLGENLPATGSASGSGSGTLDIIL